MKRVFALATLAVGLHFSVVYAQYDADIIISEVQVGSSDSASAEYIEIKNTTKSAVDLRNYSIEYKSFSGTKWNVKKKLEGAVSEFGSYLVSTEEANIDSDENFAGGFSSKGGHIRLSKEGSTVDSVSWGESDEDKTLLLPPQKNEALKRFENSEGLFALTGISSNDFLLSIEPDPESTTKQNKNALGLLLKDEVAEERASSGDQKAETSDSESKQETAEEKQLIDSILERSIPAEYLPIEITELMPDPTTPLKDALDEFIEIFNPNNIEVNIADYAIKTGTTFSRSFVFPSITLSPNQYLAIYSEDSGLTLSNSGSAAKIVNPDGRDVFVVPEYEKAEASNSYIKLEEGEWGWTTIVTPSQVNESEESEALKSEDTNDESEETDLTESKVREYGSFNASRAIYEEPEEEQSSQVSSSILAGFVGLALTYAVWEYRNEIKTIFKRP